MLTILDSSCCRQLMLLCCWWLIILLGCHWLVVLLSGRPQWLSWHGNGMVKYYLVRITEKTNKPGDPCRLVIVLSMVPSNGQVLPNKIQYVKIKKKTYHWPKTRHSTCLGLSPWPLIVPTSLVIAPYSFIAIYRCWGDSCHRLCVVGVQVQVGSARVSSNTCSGNYRSRDQMMRLLGVKRLYLVKKVGITPFNCEREDSQASQYIDVSMTWMPMAHLEEKWNLHRQPETKQRQMISKSGKSSR